MAVMFEFSVVAALVSFLVSSATIPLVRRIALAIRAIDYPGGRRTQAEGIPRLGGVAVVLGLFVSQGAVAVLRWGEWRAQISTAEMVAIPLALFIVFLSGFLEDTVGLSCVTRVLMQAAAAVLVMSAGGLSFGLIHTPFSGNVDLGFLTRLISLIWIVGVTNAVNLLDGLDGLAGGMAAIIAGSLLVFSIWQHDFVTTILMATIVGSCLGFLRKNWSPAQIYLGDAGSLSLGFFLAIVSIRSSIKTPAAIAIMVPLLALGLPVIDTLLVMLFRFTEESHGWQRSLLKRVGRMFRADRNHLHHILLGFGRSRSRIVIVIYSIAVAFCTMALFVAISKRAALGAFMIVIEILVVVGMRQFGLHAAALKLSLEKRAEAQALLLKDEPKSVVKDFKHSA